MSISASSTQNRRLTRWFPTTLTAAAAVLALSGTAHADDLSPVVAFSVLDQPLDGNGNTINAFTGLIRTQSTRADRAMQEFDVSAFAGFTVTSATISGTIFNNNAGGTFPRTFDFQLYTGNGVADVSDYEISAASVGNASWAAPTPPLEFSYDVTSAVQNLLDGGATFIGLKVVGTSQNLFPCILSASANDNAILTIEGIPGGGGSCTGDIADDFGTLGSDDQVSFGDFLALLGLIGPCPGGTVGCTGDIADDFGTLGGDAQVSFGDFLALLGLIGPCP